MSSAGAQQALQHHDSNNAVLDKQKMAVIEQLEFVLSRWRRKAIQQQILQFLPKFFALVISVLFLLVVIEFLTLQNAVVALLPAFILGALTKLLWVFGSEAYQNITLTNLIVELNQHFTELEDSAQLLLLEHQQLLPLEKLQYRKVLAAIDDVLAQQAQVNYADLSPTFNQGQFIFANCILAVVIIIFTVIEVFQLLEQPKSWFQANTDIEVSKVESSQVHENHPPVDILSQQVIIEPPRYSLKKGQQEKLVSESLDIDTLAGSNVSWVFNFSEHKVNYFIVFSNGERQQLIKHKDGSYRYKVKLSTSMVYHLAVDNQATKVSDKFTEIHHIKLTADKAPKIRFISPKNTVTEYGKNSQPTLTAEVQISDDFAVTEVEILGSIAKGSGEGVKFRDQSFTFDSNELVEGKVHYYKNWSLADLGMEPGDELYFSVLANDNREPLSQQTRSATKIIRWLEEEQVGINADGILIDFMPEYFKSQRQIIIETIELIEDKEDLQLEKFTETSELLGVAQSSLKEKYGQYLGDEFEGQHSVGVTFDDNHGDEGQQRPQVQVHDEHGGTNAVITSEQHENADSHDADHDELHQSNSGDISGRMALINRYGHNHEDSDVGVMTSQDPKALMKKSLTNMWQAELHLMLSEPELALPFEQEALRLLKLAKKAERIYVKRLGFEPPPVTEQRRYQGEQTDILNHTMQVASFDASQLSNQTQLAFRNFLKRLNQYGQATRLEQANLATITPLANNSVELSNNYAEGVLTLAEIALVEKVKAGIELLLDKRPALVDALAVIERILLERRLTLSRCDNCLQLLTAKLEQLIPQATSAPLITPQSYFEQHPLVESYGEFLREQL